MAKQSKLDREIEKADKEVERAEMVLLIAERVRAGLRAARQSDPVDPSTPKVKRGRKAKGLPKTNGAEVTQ